MFARGYCLEACNGVFGPVVDGVRVGLENADVIPHFFRYLEQIESSMDVSRDAEVGALDRDQAEEVACECRGISKLGALGEG